MRVLSSFRRILVEPALRRRALVVALYGLLSPLPLVGTLGYESSLVTTAPMSLLGIGAGVDAMRAARAAAADATTEDGASPLRTAGPAMLREVLILAGLALATLLLAQLWNPTCEPLEGLEFFALGPALSAALGGACGLGKSV
ncbi:MAG: hypothetical protein KDK70_18200, partial [Myxococcales bacterium]|nr:hypothetical protein [Myxococcales bacterium]